MGKLDDKRHNKKTNITKRRRSKNYSVRGGGYLTLPPLFSVPDILMEMKDDYIEHLSYRKVANKKRTVVIKGRTESVNYGVTTVRDNLIKLSKQLDDEGNPKYPDLVDALAINSKWKRGLKKHTKKRYKKEPFYREYLRSLILIYHFVEKVYHISKEDLEIFMYFAKPEFTQQEYMNVCKLFQPDRVDLFNIHLQKGYIIKVDPSINKAKSKYKLYGNAVTAVNTSHNIMVGHKRMKTSRIDCDRNKIQFDPEVSKLFDMHNIFVRKMKGE